MRAYDSDSQAVKIVRICGLAGAAASGLALILRAFHGPLPWMHSPMNAESVFAISLLVLALLTGDAKATVVSPQPRMDWLAPLSLVAIVAVAFAYSSHDYFLSDDFVMLRHAQTPFSLSLYTHGGGDGFFRPLIYESFRIVFPWAGEDPFRWHVTGLLIHAANTILVWMLARAFGLERFSAWFAGALFAIHATRPETAVWITGRYDLIATFFVLAALVLFLYDFPWIALIAMVAGILCKESAYAGPLLLVLLAPKQWRKWIPFFAASAILVLYRFWLFGGIGGYKTATGEPQALSINLITVIKALVLRLWAVLFVPINWSIPLGVLLGIALFAYVWAMLWLFIGKRNASPRRRIWIAAGFVIVAALPPVQQLLIGADLQKARYLYLPSVGFCLLLGLLVASRRSIAIVILLFQAIALLHNLTAWHDASVEAKAYCEAAVNGKTDAAPPLNSINGVYFFQNGLPECIRMAGK